MKVSGVCHISSPDADLFYKELNKSIIAQQDAGFDVEVQYQVVTGNNGQVIWNALVVGRK